MDEIKVAVLAFLESKKTVKTKFAPNDVAAAMPQFKKSDVKKTISALMDEGKLAYWSSGSTTYIMLKEFEGT